MNAAGWIKKPADLEPLLKVPADILPAITLGSYTLEPRDGNPGQNFWSDGAGSPTSINALGLPNPGIGLPDLAEMIASIQASKKLARINIAGFSIEDYRQLTLQAVELHPDEIELNLGCPNVRSEGKQKPIFAFDVDMVSEIIYASCKDLKIGGPTIAVKLSPYSDPALLAKIAALIGGPGVKRTVRAVVISNTFPNAYGLDDEGKMVISSGVGYGGLGGRAMKHIALGQVRQFREQLSGSQVKVIGVGGISNGGDVMDFESAGAHEAQVGTAFFLQGPKIFQEIAEQYVYFNTAGDDSE